MSAQEDSARDSVGLHAERWTAGSPFVSEAAEEQQAPIDPWYQVYTPFVEGRELEETYGAEAERESDLAALEAESRFQGAFAQGRTSLIEPEELEEEFVMEEDLRFQRPECLDLIKKITRVAVVGGGLAGLMAARRLSQFGVKVTVFEAYEEVGGRVRSNKTFSRGRITEEGAELIGSFHTKWLGLAREYGLAMVSRMDPDLYQRAGLDVKLTLDKPLLMDEFIKLEKAVKDRVLLPIAKLAAKEIRDPSRPWQQDKLKKFDGMSVQDALPKFCRIAKRTKGNKDERLWKMIEFKLVNDEVAPLDEMNFLGLLCKVRGGQGERFGAGLPPILMGYWDELEIFRCADGCQELATKMEAEIKNKPGCRVNRNTMVKVVNILKDGVKLTWVPVRDGKPDPGPGQSEDFKFVVFAIPPSVWDDVTITATDKKDARPQDEIGRLRMAMAPAVKFFSDVKERFWIKEKAAPYGGSLTLGQVWEGTDNQTRVEVEMPGPLGRPVKAKQGIVLSVFAGPILPGRRVPTRDRFEKELSVLYPGYTGNLNNTRFSDWPNESFIKTGYVSPTKNQIFEIGKKLSEPFHGRLFFAGEHTQMAFFGYMEGALRSGERAAHTLMLKACSLLQESALKSPSPPRVARAAPTRENTAFEREIGILSEEHSSTDYPEEAESPFLDRDLFAARAEEEWEPRAEALVAESPFVGALEGRRSRFDEDQLEEEEVPDQLEGEEELEAEEVWEELEEEQLTPQADQKEDESIDDEGAPLREDRTELESPEDLEELYIHVHEHQLDQGKEIAELKETEGLESDEEELDRLTEDSSEEEAAEDEYDAGPGVTVLEERQLPAPKDTELRHFHVKKTLNVAGSLNTAATASLMKPLEMRPAYIDPWLDTLETDTSATGLQGLLSALMLGRWSNFLSPESVRDKKAHATDKLYVALVDLTGAKLSKPEFAGWAPTEAVDGASIPKILALYALFQLRFDLNHLASAHLITKKADLLKRAENHWKSTGLAGRPSLGQLFSFVKESAKKPVQVKFQSWLGTTTFDINGNCSVTRLMNGLGFDYIGSVARQSGLRHPARGGLWLGTTYKCGDKKSTRWRRDPVPLIASCDAGGQSGHHITALSAATYYTLLAQGRLVDEPSSRELMTRLERGCSLSPGGFHEGLEVLGGVTRTAQKCGLLGRCTHESMLVERDRFRYAAVALAKGGGVPFNLLIQDLDKIIQRRNPGP